MNYKPYKEYKDSRVEWVGDMPLHWQLARVEHVTRKTAKNIAVKSFANKEVFYYDIPNVQLTGKGRIEQGENIDSNKFLLVGGEVVISKLNPRKSTIALTEKHDMLTICSTEFVPIFPTSVTNKFLYYMLSNIGVSTYLNSLVKSTTYSHQRVQPDQITKMLIPIPSDIEQQIIAKFLDDNLDKINRIIRQKNNQIDSLKKYRQALIAETVSRGLELHPKMKDTGVEWIGEIPEHWDIKRLGLLGDLQNGISKSSDDFGFGYPFVSYGDVYKNIELPKEVVGLVNSTRSDRYIYSVKRGDVFFTRTSETIEEIGFTSTCLETIEEATFAGFLIRFRPRTNDLLANYSKYYFRSEIHRKYFVKEMNIVTRASLSQELLKKLPVILPSLEEQQQIADFLDNKCLLIDNLINRIQQLIIDLETYKKSLIYEAVTGKIDVRNYAENNQEVTM
ncbi:restriction endonuclease subunit S [Brevibacillus sp. NRS-1366]|uniref:restriction endonuclease subunit S n=1 Tax=Brevibacillus sp. NRS-1366 TaxID=3233899 RepID=UPI003D1C1C66